MFYPSSLTSCNILTRNFCLNLEKLRRNVLKDAQAFGVFVLICIATFLLSAASASGPCEEIEIDWEGFVTIKTCYMRETTAIDSKDFLITSDRDETVERFDVWANKKVEHLPKNLGAKFPNLLVLKAQQCSIREVNKENFKGLSKLRELLLYDNQIEKIDDDTFKFIPEVEEIRLDRNKIKKLNGLAFVSLHKLETVFLKGNGCINKDFYPAKIAEMLQIVTEKCGFVVKCNIESCSSEKSKLEADLKAQLAEVSSLKSGNERLEIEKTQLESLHNESKAQLLLVSVAAFVTVAILLGIIVALIKKR